MRYIFLPLFALITGLAFSQNKTDVSLFMKEDPGHLLSEVLVKTYSDDPY